MKGKKYIFLIALLVLLSQLAAANEVSAVWTRLYERARSYPQKQQIMMNIVEQHSRDMIPVLTEALDTEVRNLRNTSGITEKSMQVELMKTIVKELGRLKAIGAAEVVRETVENVADPFLKGEAIIALGKMGARQYTGELAMMLRNLNFNMDDIQNQRENEIVAYAIVFALERLKSDEGYTPVFFASRGWYSSRSGVKERAEEALKVMVDDPTEQLTNILLSDTDYENKLAALEAEEMSSAPELSKARLAAMGLAEGLKYSPKNLTEERQLKTLRLTSLRLLEKYPLPEDTEVLDNMARVIQLYRTERAFDEDEMISLMETMGSYEGEDVARILAQFLAYYNNRRDTTPPDSYRIVISLVQALGNVGNIAGLEELTMITISDYWESSVKREARAAIEKIQ